MASTVYPTFLTGQRLTADLLTSSQPVWVRKSANESVTSSTTLQDDDELVVSGAAGTWLVEMELLMSCANSGAAGTADAKTGWTSTGTITNGTKWVFGPSTASGDANDGVTTRHGAHNMTTTVNYRGRSGTSQFHVREISSFVATTAWSVQLQWAQATSSGTAMSVVAGSWIRAQRMV